MLNTDRIKKTFQSISKVLFSFEMVFVLFLFSYQYKHLHPLFESFDITLLLSIIIIFSGFIIFFKTKPQNDDYAGILFFIWISWTLLTSFWSPNYYYTLSKSMCLIFYTIPAFLIARYVIAQDQNRFYRFYQSIILFSIVIMVSALRTYFIAPTQLSNLFDTTYLVTGQTIGAGLILLVVNFFFNLSTPNNQFSKTSFLSVILLMGFVFISLHLGGRGPVLSMVLALFVFLGLSYINNTDPLIQRKYLGFIFISVIFCFLLLKFTFDLTSIPFFKRMTSAFSNSSFDESISLRFSYYQSALKCFLDNPLKGIGLGGWPAYNGLGDVRWHPHNIILEIASETGILGILSMGLFLNYTLWQFKKSYNFRNALTTSTLLLLIFSGLNALKSGDLNDNIFLFTILGLLSTRTIQKV